jgi:hypothetical protein
MRLRSAIECYDDDGVQRKGARREVGRRGIKLSFREEGIVE